MQHVSPDIHRQTTGLDEETDTSFAWGLTCPSLGLPSLLAVWIVIIWIYHVPFQTLLAKSGWTHVSNKFCIAWWEFKYFASCCGSRCCSRLASPFRWERRQEDRQRTKYFWLQTTLRFCLNCVFVKGGNATTRNSKIFDFKTRQSESRKHWQKTSWVVTGCLLHLLHASSRKCWHRFRARSISKKQRLKYFPIYLACVSEIWCQASN